MQKWLFLLLLVPALSVAEPLRVFASVAPIQTFVQKVGGEHVDARVMVRPGFNPHTYDPTPQQISALAGAALYVRTGVPFELAWMQRIRAANRNMQVIDARAGIDLRAMEAHGHDEHGHEKGHQEDAHDSHDDHGHAEHAEEGEHRVTAAEQDPHVWTNPVMALQMLGAIRDKLQELAPQHAAAFKQNHDAYAKQLVDLDNELHALLDSISYRKFIVFHPAWGYFADQYTLVQVPIEQQGNRPGARALAALIDQAKHENIKVVFVQPQFDRRQARQVARAIGGAVVAVDPLAANYVANMQKVGQEFAQALQP